MKARADCASQHLLPRSAFLNAWRSKPFLHFMWGSLISRVGDWMDLTAMNWAILQWTHSPLALGAVNACRLLPALLCGLPAGVLADRMNRRQLLLLLQTGIMLLSLLLFFLFLQQVHLGAVLVGIAARSALQTMEPIVRNALFPNLVTKEAVPSAIAANVAVLNLSRIIGPAVAGTLMLYMEPEMLILLNGLSTPVVLWSLLLLPRTADASASRMAQETSSGLGEAFRYIRSHPVVLSLLWLAVVPMVFLFPYTSMLPVFARDLLKVGPESFGALLSMSAAGALTGSLWLSFGRPIRRTGLWLLGSIVMCGLGLLCFLFSSFFWQALASMYAVGLFSQIYRTMSRITLQMQVDDRLRGRLLSIALMDRGFIPLGALLFGAVAEWANALAAGLAMAAGCIVVTLLVGGVHREIRTM
nr:MFS transporter [Brevibacillus sp. SYP-B805]